MASAGPAWWKESRENGICQHFCPWGMCHHIHAPLAQAPNLGKESPFHVTQGLFKLLPLHWAQEEVSCGRAFQSRVLVSHSSLALPDVRALVFKVSHDGGSCAGEPVVGLNSLPLGGHQGGATGSDWTAPPPLLPILWGLFFASLIVENLFCVPSGGSQRQLSSGSL